MNAHRQLPHYGTSVVAVAAASFVVAYTLPWAAAPLGGLLFVLAPVPLALALVRPVGERLRWLQGACLALLSVVPLLSSVSGGYGVHITAGVTAALAGAAFLLGGSARRSWAFRPTAAALGALGLALLSWGWYGPGLKNVVLNASRPSGIAATTPAPRAKLAAPVVSASLPNAALRRVALRTNCRPLKVWTDPVVQYGRAQNLATLTRREHAQRKIGAVGEADRLRRLRETNARTYARKLASILDRCDLSSTTVAALP